MAKDLLDKTGLTYLATKFQDWCEGLFVKGGSIKHIKVVTSLPASPSNDTLYLIKQ
jgi:hypothetical protein